MCNIQPPQEPAARPYPPCILDCGTPRLPALRSQARPEGTQQGSSPTADPSTQCCRFSLSELRGETRGVQDQLTALHYSGPEWNKAEVKEGPAHRGCGCGVTDLATGALTAIPAGWDVSPVLREDACKQKNYNNFFFKKPKLLLSVSILKKAGVEEAALWLGICQYFDLQPSQYKCRKLPPNLLPALPCFCWTKSTTRGLSPRPP